MYTAPKFPPGACGTTDISKYLLAAVIYSGAAPKGSEMHY